MQRDPTQCVGFWYSQGTLNSNDMYFSGDKPPRRLYVYYDLHSNVNNLGLHGPIWVITGLFESQICAASDKITNMDL